MPKIIDAQKLINKMVNLAEDIGELNARGENITEETEELEILTELLEETVNQLLEERK